MAQTFYPIDPVEVTPETANDWIEVDASAYVPAGATGVILHLVRAGSPGYAIGLRKNGSTDDRTQTMYYCHCWAAIGVDASRILEAYVGHITSVDIYLVGYTMSGVTFFTNAYDKSLANTANWYDIDCHTETPSAIGLIWEIAGIATTTALGMRKNGSTDARIEYTYNHYTFGVIIGCDASQICEGYIGSTDLDFFLVGYITDGCTFNTNATDVSLSTTVTWLDLAALPATANMGFIEIRYVSSYGLRKNGSAEEIYTYSYGHPWAFVECDASQLIEGKIGNVGVDFFVVGYSTVPAAPVDYPISTSCNLSLTASIDRDVAWDRGTSSGLTVSTTIARSMGRLITTAANLTVSSTVARLMACNRAITSNLTASTTILKGWGRKVTTTANLTISATVALIKGFVRAVTSNLTASATIDRDVTYTRASTPGLTVSSTVDRNVTYTRATQSPLSVAVTILKGWGRVITTSPGLTVSVTVLKGWGRTITTSAGLTVSATISKALAFKRAVLSGLTISTTIVRTLTFTKAITTNLIASISIARTTAYKRAISAGLTIATIVSRVVDFNRAVLSNLTAAVTILKSHSRTITTSTALSISTTINRVLAYSRATTANLTVSVIIRYCTVLRELIRIPISRITAIRLPMSRLTWWRRDKECSDD